MSFLTPEPLAHVSVFVAEDDVAPVTAALMRAAALHLDVSETERWTPNPAWADHAEAYRALRDRADAVARTLGLADAPLRDGGDAPLRPERERPALESDVLRLETRTGGWRDDLAAAEARVAELEEARERVALLAPLGTPVEALRDLEHHHLAIGSLPSENVERVAAALFQVPFVLIPLERGVTSTLVAAATAREDGHVLDRALRAAFFDPAPLPPEASGAPDAAKRALDASLADARERLAAIRADGEALREELADLATRTRARIATHVQLCDAIRRFPFRDGVYVVGGWLSDARRAAVEADLHAVATRPLVVEALPAGGGAPGAPPRAVPTLVRTPRWLRPFETLVDTFGTTEYRELHPTVLVTAVFLFTFGMMFGDLGHGAILAAIGGVLALRGVRLGVVVAAAGGAAMAFGAAYGVAFGAEVFPAPWLQPLHAIFEILIAAVLAGVAIVNAAMVLNLVTTWRAGARVRFWIGKYGVLDVAFYWALLGGGAATFLGALPGAAWAAVALPLAAAVMLREPLEAVLAGVPPRWGEHLVPGFFELFETTIGNVSNSLSFVRMGAFAVAHEGLSQMVLSYGQGPSGWAVLLLGTTLIVGFEGLIVAIQALRLSYYEFFGRFFGGRGVRFRPLAFAGGPHD